MTDQIPGVSLKMFGIEDFVEGLTKIKKIPQWVTLG